MNERPTPRVLHELLTYDPETGALFWRVRDRKWFPTDNAMARWNGRFAGKEAGSVNAALGYRIIVLLGYTTYAHRIAYTMHNGDWPEVTDHINGVRTDNRAANLRSVSDATNKRNLKRPTSNSSGVAGIYMDSQTKKWRAGIQVDGRTINLGRFSSKDAAIAARANALREHGFHENHGREITA